LETAGSICDAANRGGQRWPPHAEEGLRELSDTERQNMAIAYQSTTRHLTLLPNLAANLVQARMGLEAVGDLRTGFPDGIGPAMPGLVSCRLIAPLEQVHKEHPQVALQRPPVAPAHAGGSSRVGLSGKKSFSNTCATVNGQVSGKRYPVV
jgi:hypothetical protein